MAALYDLKYEEIPGSNRIIEKLLRGTWDGDFIVVEPGEQISYEIFIDHGGGGSLPIHQPRNGETTA
jgi:hypothetical protein